MRIGCVLDLRVISFANVFSFLHHFQHKISPVPPDEYADRFYAFMKAIMRGGDGGDSFKP